MKKIALTCCLIIGLAASSALAAGPPNGLKTVPGSFMVTLDSQADRPALRGLVRAFGGEVRYEWGDYYNGNLTTIEASTIFRPSALLTVELGAERNTGEALWSVDCVREYGTEVPEWYAAQCPLIEMIDGAWVSPARA